MKVILHVGMEKTGTTSIQEFLLQNKSRLLKKGYFYLHAPGRNEYRDFPTYCMNDSRVDEYLRWKGVVNESAKLEFNTKFLHEFRLAVSLIPESVHTVVISSEHFSSRLNTAEEVTRARELLNSLFSSVEVVIYLRAQSELICSSYSTEVKTGVRVSFSTFFDLKVNNYDHEGRLNLWAGVFGYEDVRVRLFEADFFSGGSLLSDFFGLFYDGSFKFSDFDFNYVKRNTSFSSLGCTVMRILNYLFPDRVRGIVWVENYRVDIIKYISDNFNGSPVSLTLEQKRFVESIYSESNAAICMKYFPDRNKLFKDDV